MLESIVSVTAWRSAAVYALIGITYNVMFSASRVFSFTAGTLGMLGGVLGALFIARMGMPVLVGFVLALAGGAVLGVVTEIVAVRPVLKSLDQHLYVLSTLALRPDDPAVHRHRVEHRAAAVPAPARRSAARLVRPAVLAADAGLRRRRSSGLELLYRRTLVGRAFLAIAEDNYAARALGLPERGLRMASYRARRRDRRAGRLRRRARCCSPSSATRRC